MNKLYQCGSALTLLSIAGFSVSQTPPTARDIIQEESNTNKHQEIEADDKVLLDKVPASELKRMGWAGGVDTKDYINALTHQARMTSGFNDHFKQRGYQFSEVDCVISDQIKMNDENSEVFIDVADSYCTEFKQTKNEWDTDQSKAYLVEVNFTEIDLLGSVSEGEFTIKNDLYQDILIDRKIKVDASTLFNRQLVVVSNQCTQSDVCSTELMLESHKSHGLIEAKLVGVYHAGNSDKNLSSSAREKTPQFVNGDFNNGSSNWVWLKESRSSFCPGVGSVNSPDPADNRTPEIRSRNGNPYAFTGGFTASSNVFEGYSRSTIHQSVQVPSNAVLKFSRRITPGRRGILDLPVNMYVGAENLTTGLFDYVYFQRTSRQLDFETIEVDLSGFANHTVKFRFEVCSLARIGTQNERHGSIGLDEIRFETFAPPEPRGSLSSDSPCVIPAGANQCDTIITANTTNAPFQCMWLRSAKSLISCSSNASNSVLWPHTNVNGHFIDLKSHNSLPSNTSNAYNSAPLLDSIVVVGQVQQASPDDYDDVNLRGFTDDVVGDAEPLFAGASPQVHNFHDTGDQDWVIFALNIGQGVDVKTIPTGTGSVRMTAYRVNLSNIIETVPGRRDIELSDLTAPINHSSQSGINTLTIQNTSINQGFYVVKMVSSGTIGSQSAYTIRSTFNNPIAPADDFDDVSVRGYTDDLPGDAVPLFAGQAAQNHNFHDSGDQDWTIFALGGGQSVRVEYSAIENANVRYEVYKLPGLPTVTSPGRWNINQATLSNPETGNTALSNQNKVVIQNTDTVDGYYLIKSRSTGPSGFLTGYQIKSVQL